MAAFFPLPQPPVIKKKTFFLSLCMHGGLLLFVLISPYLVFKKEIISSPKFFEVVDMQVHRKKEPAIVRKKEQETKKTAEHKTAPDLSAKANKSAVEEQEENAYTAPTEVSVSDNNFKYDWYLAHLCATVERFWDPPRGVPGESNLKVVVFFRILRSGEISGLELKQSSGNETLDRLGLRSIERAAPFPKLPPRFTGETLNVSFTLNYMRQSF
jgi:TonB family protein